MKLSRILPAFAGMVLLSACAAGTNDWDTAGVAAMKPTGSAFSQALHKRYVERAAFEVSEGDWSSVAFFNSRARMAGEGKAVGVQPVEQRSLKAGVDEIKAAHAKLTAALATNAPEVNPDACALSQTWFEHWMEQQEEGHQADHIAMAKDGYMKAIPQCVGKVVVAPLPAKSFQVYFDLNKTDITAEAAKTIADAVAEAKKRGSKAIHLVGHADNSGPKGSAYNMQLSAKRADAVKAAMVKKGIDAKAVATAAKGDTSLLVQTPADTRELKNRRVEIVVP